jgi:DNA-binding transcriptional ArsR family regulator
LTVGNRLVTVIGNHMVTQEPNDSRPRESTQSTQSKTSATPTSHPSRQSSRRDDRPNAVFRAIADPTRRDILGLLRGGQHSVGEIASCFTTSRPAISKHLRLLRDAGLVVSHRRGASQLCGLNAKPLRAIDDWLKDYETFWAESLTNLKRYVERNPRNHRNQRNQRNQRNK